jgi:SWI/SNF related-matrix-associated actin-dependent regulator of chromatin subfamily C
LVIKINFKFLVLYFENFRKHFDLTVLSRHDICKLFEYIQKLLIEHHVLTFPICYLRSDIEKHLQIQLKKIIEKHQGTIVENEEDADHIIYSILNENQKESQIERERNEEFMRVVEKRGYDCRLHYWFYPDSFDIWISNINAVESEKRDENFQGIWHVTANWILDTDVFNEWMNEEDYEIDEDLVGRFC